MRGRVSSVIFFLFFIGLSAAAYANTANFTINLIPSSVGVYTPEQSITWCQMVRSYFSHKDPNTGEAPTLNCQYSSKQLTLAFAANYTPVTIQARVHNQLSCLVYIKYVAANGAGSSTGSFPSASSKTVTALAGTILKVSSSGVWGGKSQSLLLPYPNSSGGQADITCHSAGASCYNHINCDVKVN